MVIPSVGGIPLVSALLSRQEVVTGLAGLNENIQWQTDTSGLTDVEAAEPADMVITRKRYTVVL